MGGISGNDAPRGTFSPVALSSRRPPLERWAFLAAVALLLVVVKPWPSPDQAAKPTAPPRVGTGSGTGSVPTATASGVSPDSAASLVTAFCLDTRSWLVASVERSVERSVDQRIRVWRALEPATAALGPDDPAIPVISLVSEGLNELGWCARIVGAGKPIPPVEVATWVRAPGGARPITLDSSRPVSEGSPYGELYRPPGRSTGATTAFWSNGTYVFRYREADGRQLWFAIEVEIRRRPSVEP